MAVDSFTKSEFESALPQRKDGSGPAWEYVGVEGGEHCYLLPLPNGIGVKIHSSVNAGSNLSDGCGENSIRIYLIDMDTRRPAGSKLGRWTTRVPGWGERMVGQARELAKLAMKITPCPKCGARQKVLKVTKEGPNRGRFFIACTPDCKQFQWID